MAEEQEKTTISRADLAKSLTTELGGTVHGNDELIKALFAKINSEIKSGNDVRIHDFGTFKLKNRAARTGRNPKTGDSLEIPASSTLAFKATKHGK